MSFVETGRPAAAVGDGSGSQHFCFAVMQVLCCVCVLNICHITFVYVGSNVYVIFTSVVCLKLFHILGIYHACVWACTQACTWMFALSNKQEHPSKKFILDLVYWHTLRMFVNFYCCLFLVFVLFFLKTDEQDCDLQNVIFLRVWMFTFSSVFPLPLFFFKSLFDTHVMVEVKTF